MACAWRRSSSWKPVIRARNAGLLAVRILAASDDTLRARMTGFQEELRRQAQAKGAALRERTKAP